MEPTCFKCGEPFFEGSCVWCTCGRCVNDIRDGSCWFCDSNTYNNFPNFSDYPPQPNLYQQYCERCGRNIIGGFSSFCESFYTNGFNPNYQSEITHILQPYQKHISQNRVKNP